MNKLYLSLFLTFAVFFFLSCDEDSNPISSDNMNTASQNDTIVDTTSHTNDTGITDTTIDTTSNSDTTSDNTNPQIGSMKLIPSGGMSFEMGIKDTNDNYDYTYRSLPVHNVTFTNNFYMDSVEVTAEKYTEVINWAYRNGYVELINEADGDDGLYNHNGDRKKLTSLSAKQRIVRWSDEGDSLYVWIEQENKPMDHVSWYGAAFYSNMLSLREGKEPVYDLSDWSYDFGKNGYRLPTEAEWEFACRGGSVTPWFWGATEDDADLYAHHGQTFTTSVATYKPNNYGLYDMVGNAIEWCNDLYNEGYDEGAVIDPLGPDTSEWAFDTRVLRLDSGDGSELRSGSRSGENALITSRFSLGFRLVMNVE